MKQELNVAPVAATPASPGLAKRMRRRVTSHEYMGTRGYSAPRLRQAVVNLLLVTAILSLCSCSRIRFPKLQLPRFTAWPRFNREAATTLLSYTLGRFEH